MRTVTISLPLCNQACNRRARQTHRRLVGPAALATIASFSAGSAQPRRRNVASADGEGMAERVDVANGARHWLDTDVDGLARLAMLWDQRHRPPTSALLREIAAQELRFGLSAAGRGSTPARRGLRGRAGSGAVGMEVRDTPGGFLRVEPVSNRP